MAFFLGTTTDGEGTRVEYKPKHLTTHGLVFGMTGSGKTGLCVGILEEASRHDIPVIAIDPKGDLTNLALSWPSLDPKHFADWIDPGKLDDGKVTAAELGEKMARIWKDGLARDGQDGSTIREFRSRTGITVYTPGSTAGVPVSMLSRFDPPPAFGDMTDEDKSDQISGVVSALLALLDIDADPLQSEEYILLSNIMDHHWARGETLDLPKLIKAIYEPPFQTLGVFDLEEFFPQKKRKAFAMQVNALIASPSFKVWLTGEPLDIDRLLRREPGGSRNSIFYIAHLDDAERMAFVALLLDKIVGWMRAQPGSGDLRALLYFDEVFGYLPPYPKNPASKRPLLTILKQARAFGLGALLATQNPVDVDYKAITNAGTWLIGKLQTEQDKERILDGLMGAEGSANISRSSISKLISGLESREFLLQNAHVSDQVTFKTRFVMSYLRGPMTRNEIIKLTANDFYNLPEAKALTASTAAPARPERKRPRRDADGVVMAEIGGKPAAPSGSTVQEGGEVVEFDTLPGTEGSGAGRDQSLEDLSADVLRMDERRSPSAKRRTSSRLAGTDERFLSSEGLRVPALRSLLGIESMAGIGKIHYRPALMARARLTFKVASHGQIPAGTISRIVYPVPVTPGAVGWMIADAPVNARVLETAPQEPCDFSPPPQWLRNVTDREHAQDLFIRTLIKTQRASVPVCPPLDRFGEPGESLSDFRARLASMLTEASDRAHGKLDNRRSVEVAIWQRQIDEMRELLEMDKRELTIVRASGDEDELERVTDRTRFRIEKYKKLVATRDRILAGVDRDMADVEFSVIDKLEACEMAELTLEPKGIGSAFFGVLWIPNR